MFQWLIRYCQQIKVKYGSAYLPYWKLYIAEETSFDKFHMFWRLCDQNKIQDPNLTSTIVTSNLNVHHVDDTIHHRNFKSIEAG